MIWEVSPILRYYRKNKEIWWLDSAKSFKRELDRHHRRKPESYYVEVNKLYTHLIFIQIG